MVARPEGTGGHFQRPKAAGPASTAARRWARPVWAVPAPFDVEQPEALWPDAAGWLYTSADLDPSTKTAPPGMATTRRKLACWKSRPAPEPEPRWLTIKPDPGGDILLNEAAPYEPPSRTPALDDIETGACADPKHHYCSAHAKPP